jgi:hypothetical protein
VLPSRAEIAAREDGFQFTSQLAGFNWTSLEGDAMNAEQTRLEEARSQATPWRKWGPYLSERQWGTVREDYSDSGNAWDYFSHDQSRSRAYRRGYVGLGGFTEKKPRLCFSVALWNGKDPILKERLFGLTNSEGNHGEDVKEYYYYLDSTPTHSYMKYLYKYPQAAYPYDDLVATNRRRSRTEPEYELIDTGIFDNDEYIDVFVEYAKAGPEDILIQITLCNRGDVSSLVHVLPTLWYRNTWSWVENSTRPSIVRAEGKKTFCVKASHGVLGSQLLFCDGEPDLLFTENETNNQRLFDRPNRTPYVKDGINNYIVRGQKEAVNPEPQGTKVAAYYEVPLMAHGEQTIRLRLRDSELGGLKIPFGGEFDALMRIRKREADEFYASVTSPQLDPDEKLVVRQAMSGMLWSKQHYFFNVHDWLAERGVDPLRGDTRATRNRDWFHMVNDHVISMPDKWEYPWYAAWDLAFHTVPLAMVDLDFAKEQLDLVLGDLYLHPNGQVPAYEWNFSDVNPPVHAWAALYLFRMEQAQRGKGDYDFLARMFARLTLNFTWWVNRKDRFGKNLFEGGFLGLDNIGVFDRSSPLPTGGCLEQADGTAWMALFCQNMLEICVELAAVDPSFDEMASRFCDHFLWIAAALNNVGPDGMWDEEDGFYYDVLRLPDGRAQRLKVRSLVGLLPMCATTVIEPWQRERMPKLMERMRIRIEQMPQLIKNIHPTGRGNLGYGERGILGLVNPQRLRRILSRVLDENEFLSPFGIRSISRFHRDHPYVTYVQGKEYRVDYLPAESDSGLFGGNSNWRGPIWMPINGLIIRALMSFYLYYGNDFLIECPTGSGKKMNLLEVAREISTRLQRIFLLDKHGRRPVFGAAEKFQTDPHFRDNILFYEYFHGDNGAGIGASHQTGWTGIVAHQLSMFADLDANEFLQGGRKLAYQIHPENFPATAVAKGVT